MPLCPQITNTPITVTQTADFTVTSVIPAVPDTVDGLAETLVVLGDGTQVFYQNDEPTDPPNTLREGDLWFDTNDGNKLYYYNGTAWVSARDAGISQAQATADGKNKIFRQTTAPTATAIGDTWFDTDDGNKLYYWTGSAWVSVQDNAIATAQATADSKIKTFYQTTAPTATGIGDVWFDTDDGNKQYRWNGSSWVSVQDTAIAAATSAANAATAAAAAASSAAAAAQAAATAAQTTADGKNKIYRQTTQPSTGPFAEGDLWFDTDDDNKIYRYTSGSWATAVELGNNAIASLSANKLTAGTIDASVITVSNINAGNISTGTLNADRIAAASITGSKIAANTITAANITAGTITSAEIATGTITASDIATGTITASQIASGTITGSLIAAGTITATNIAANTITASQIAAGTITATQIAAGTITATQISSAYVYAGTLAASQITTGTLTGISITLTSGTKTLQLDASTGLMSITDSSTGLLTSAAITITANSISTYYTASGMVMGSDATLDVMNELGGYSGTPRLYASASRAIRIVPNAGLLGTTYPVYIEGSIDITSRIQCYGNVNIPNIPSTTSAANVRWTTGGVGQLQYVTSSTMRVKDNIVNLVDVEELDPKALLSLPVRAFTYKAEHLGEDDDRFGVLVPGFIAEEVDQVYPIAADYDPNGPVNWNDRYIIPGMLALIQDLYKKIGE